MKMIMTGLATTQPMKKLRNKTSVCISVQPPIEAASDAGTPAVEPHYGLILAGADSDIGDANCD